MSVKMNILVMECGKEELFFSDCLVLPSARKYTLSQG